MTAATYLRFESDGGILRVSHSQPTYAEERVLPGAKRDEAVLKETSQSSLTTAALTWTMN